MLEERGIDLKEKEKVEEFITSGCGCHLSNGKSCSSQYSGEHYQTLRADSAALSWDELNMVLMGQVSAYKQKSYYYLTV